MKKYNLVHYNEPHIWLPSISGWGNGGLDSASSSSSKRRGDMKEESDAICISEPLDLDSVVAVGETRGESVGGAVLFETCGE